MVRTVKNSIAIFINPNNFFNFVIPLVEYVESKCVIIDANFMTTHGWSDMKNSLYTNDIPFRYGIIFRQVNVFYLIE